MPRDNVIFTYLELNKSSPPFFYSIFFYFSQFFNSSFHFILFVCTLWMTYMWLAILSSPGMGHTIPVLVLGNRLATIHKLEVTILVITTKILDPTKSQFSNQHLQYVSLNCPPLISQVKSDEPKNQLQNYTWRCMRLYRALAVRSAIQSTEYRPDALVVDLFCFSALPIADEFNVSKYVYVSTNARATSLFMYCHVLDKEIKGSYLEQQEPLKIPGCKPIELEDIVDPMLDRNEREYQEYMRTGIEFRRCDGILINTCEALEPISLEVLRENAILRSIVKAPGCPIGPLTRLVEATSSKSEVSEWLNKHPAESVIYVSFGSGAIISCEQIIELAWGFELSQQRFIWVVRPGGSNQGSNSNSTMDYLPEGFRGRTKKLGMVIPTRFQQVEILGHPSTGGFLSHCEWNSTLESITSGVPMIAWPLYAGQKLNATMLLAELCVVVRPEVLPTKKVVEREVIEEMIRKFMQYEEGRAMREKVRKMKFIMENALRGPRSNRCLMSLKR